MISNSDWKKNPNNSSLSLFFQITSRWLTDLEEFNEWMNEEDYIIEGETVSYVIPLISAIKLFDCNDFSKATERMSFCLHFL